MTPTTSRQVRKLATAASKCSVQAAEYGKCIVADYNGVEKGKCSQEFLKLKDCYLSAARK